MLSRRCAALLLGLAGAAGALQAGQGRPPAAVPLPSRDMHFVTEPLPPFSYLEAGRPAGPMVEVLEAACARLAWRCRIDILPWRRALRMARLGEVQGLFSLAIPPTTRQRFHVSPVVVEGRYVLYGRGEGAAAADGEPPPLGGRVLGVYGPSAAEDALRDLLEARGDAGAPARVEVEGDNRAVLRKLAGSRYGADGLALANEAVAAQLMREEGLGGLRVVGVVKRFGYAYGLVRSRVDTADAQAFAAAIDALCRSGHTAEIMKRHGLTATACGLS